VDKLLTFLIEIGLLAGGVLFLVLAIMALLPFPWYWLATRRPVRMILTDMTGQAVPVKRHSLLMHETLEGLGFARIGVMGARWPWTRTPFPLRLLRSQDGRVVAHLMDRVVETQVGLESRLDDGFIVITVFPDTLRYADESIDTVGTMTSPAGAVDGHMARLLVAEAEHGPARRFDDVADFIRVGTETGDVPSLAYRRTLLGRSLRSSLALAAVSLGLVVVFTFQLLRVLQGEAGRLQ
jgi:hypothetical protein